MQTYSKFRPTGFDVAGLGCKEQQDWLVAPCGQNRDSDVITRSNYAVQLRELERIDPEGNDHEEHSFGHWACGHFDLVLVRPGSACAVECEGFEGALEGYPILDESHYSEACLEDEDEAWGAWGAHEFLKALAAHHGIDSDDFEHVTAEQAFAAWHEACQDAGWSTEHDSEGPRFNFEAEVLDRVDLSSLKGKVA